MVVQPLISDDEEEDIQLLSSSGDDQELEKLEEGQVLEENKPELLENEGKILDASPKKKKKRKLKKKKKKKVYTANMVPDQKPYDHDEYEIEDDEEKLEYMEQLWLKNR